MRPTASARPATPPSPGDPLVPMPFRVAAVRRELPDVTTMVVRPAAARQPACRFAPGQFNMLTVFGVGEAPISISGDPSDEDGYRHTTRAVGAVTRAICALKPGATVGLRGPFGTAWPVAEAIGQDVLLVAGGIGLAPLRSALYALVAQRSRYGRITLLYGTRTPRDLLFRRELERWRGRLDLEVRVTVDRATVGWRGGVGIVTRLIHHAPFDPLNTVAFVCGPELMMRFAIDDLVERGLTDDAISLSLERNMKCGVGLCGHCQYGPGFVCRHGPVFRLDRLQPWWGRQEV